MKHIAKGKSLFSVFFVATLDNFGFAIVFILFAPLIIDNTAGLLDQATSPAYRKAVLSTLFAVFPLAQLIAAPVFGDFADRFGRKRALVVTIIGTTLGFLCSAIAIEFGSLIGLIGSRFATGLFAGNLSICLAAIADVCRSERERARYFGYITVVFALSWIASMVAGGYLSDPSVLPFFGPTLPLYLTASLSFFSFLFVLFFFVETHPGKKHVDINLLKGLHNIVLALKITEMRPFFIVNLIRAVAWGIVIQWYAVYALEHFGVVQRAASTGLLVLGAFWTLGGLLVGPLLLRRFSTHVVATIVFFATALFLFPVPFANSFLFFSAACWLAGIASSVTMSTTLNLISISAPPSVQGKAMGLGQSVMSLGWFFVPLIGALFGGFSIAVLYGVAAFLFLVGGSLLALIRQRS
jgi:MFS family permease